MQGLGSELADLLNPLDVKTLLQSTQQVASGHPTEVYSYVAEMLRRGEAVEREQLEAWTEKTKRRIGFCTPQEREKPGQQNHCRQAAGVRQGGAFRRCASR
jgi:hypothetical protein